ncbi:1,2-phenylacetyl-CoA epoxidase subunit PaaE [Pollutibacter soli]|uniref:1,2-phenylacetyl-CoA epoxidase subunit PaaE n=1 Tax=Pollutibacter soli TaxID=3034157 RepID=UPI00301364F1
MAVHFHPLTIRDIRKETPDCISVEFEIPEHLKDQFAFIHGQNLTLRKTIDGTELRRSYSICTSPHEKSLRIAIKKAESGKFSGFANEFFRVGDQVDVMTPTGSFHTVLNKAQKKHYLAFASGSGITPIISILKAILFFEPESEFTLVYGNRNRNSIIFREELENLKNQYMTRFRLIHILSREEAELPLFSGRIDAEKCIQLFKKLINIRTIDEFFICGPEQMIRSVNGFLSEQGVEEKKVHFELFTTPGEQQLTSKKDSSSVSTSGEQAKVTIMLDGKASSFTLNYYGDSILNAALHQGMDLPYACKGGICSSCKAKLLIGEVEMEANYALGKDELTQGFILTCQSHPRSPDLFINFDDR